jgi:hypothetical protein
VRSSVQERRLGAEQSTPSGPAGNPEKTYGNSPGMRTARELKLSENVIPSGVETVCIRSEKFHNKSADIYSRHKVYFEPGNKRILYCIWKNVRLTHLSRNMDNFDNEKKSTYLTHASEAGMAVSHLRAHDPS